MPANDSLIGKTIDEKFELIEVIGSGGFSTVYRARHLALDRMVAFKLLRADVVSTVERVRRFEDEARIVSNLAHPNICIVYDCGILDSGQPYLVLENAEGSSLEDLLLGGRVLPLARALSIIRQIALGLQGAHAQNVLHRDLKPGNIMLVADTTGGESVKIIDFGIARLASMKQDVTATGHTAGTPAYMSPEQVRDEELDIRSDIYSFGCVVYEILTGRRPFESKTAFETMSKHLHCEPPPMKDGNYLVPFALRDVTLKCLMKDPAERYQSMSDVVARLSDVERELGAQLMEVPRKQWSMKRSVATASVLGVVVACAGLAVMNAIPHAAPNTNSAKTIKYDPVIAKMMDEFKQFKKAYKWNSANHAGQSAFDLLVQRGQLHTNEMVLVAREMRDYYLSGLRYPEAVRFAKACLDAQVKLAGNDKRALYDARMEAANAFASAAHEEDAREQYLQAAKLATQLHGKRSKEYADVIAALAACEIRAGLPDDAESHFLEIMSSANNEYVNNGAYRLNLLRQLCTLYVNEGKLQQASKTADLAVESITEKTNPVDRAGLLRLAAGVAERRHEWDKALMYIDEALVAAERGAKPNEPFHLTSELLSLRASLLRQKGDYAQAEPAFRKALAALRTTHKLATAEYTWAVFDYTKLLRATGRVKEAEALERIDGITKSL
jgi:serine/threonine protein kinase